LDAVHEAEPEERFAVQRLVAPAAKATVPPGVPVEPEVESTTLAE
jgi:hypothetical protein